MMTLILIEAVTKLLCVAQTYDKTLIIPICNENSIEINIPWAVPYKIMLLKVKYSVNNVR